MDKYILPSSPQELRNMTPAALKAHFDSFQTQIPYRLRCLEQSVSGTKGYERWVASFTDESLRSLSQWFQTRVETRIRTEEEKREISSKSTYSIQISDFCLTDQSLSLVVDIGLYFAKMIVTNFHNVKWDLPLKNKKFVDYGQPVLTGFEPVGPLNPLRIVLTVAYGIADGSKSGEELLRLYNVWSDLARKNQK